jgi:hypothetical protein
MPMQPLLTAYKRLIMRYHPDREGGDSERAAEITAPTASFVDLGPSRTRSFSRMTSPTALSNDYLAIDSRLDRIRLHVQMALAPVTPTQMAPAQSN